MFPQKLLAVAFHGNDVERGWQDTGKHTAIMSDNGWSLIKMAGWWLTETGQHKGRDLTFLNLLFMVINLN